MSKVGIIGDKDSIMGFLALGIDIFPEYAWKEKSRKPSIAWLKRNMLSFILPNRPVFRQEKVLQNIRTLNCQPSLSSPVSAAAWVLA